MSADRMDTMQQTERDPDAIRRDIRRTRGELDGTVDELVDRLSVGNLVDEVWQRVRHSGAGDGVGSVLREHPVPLALMGLGLGWLAVEQATGSSVSPSLRGEEGRHRSRRTDGFSREGTFHTGRMHDGDGMGDTLTDDEEGGEGLGDRISHLSHRVAEGASNLADRVSEKTDEVKDRMSGKRDELSERLSAGTSDAGETARDMGRKAREQATQAREGLMEMMQDRPLTLGSIVFGLGLASGLSLPSSRVEDRQLGETADRLKGEAKRMGRKGAEKVKQAGKEVAGAARDAGKEAVGAAIDETRSRLEETRAHGDDGADRTADTERADPPAGGKPERERQDEGGAGSGIEETHAPDGPAGTRRETGMPGTSGRKGSHGTTDTGGFGGTGGSSGPGGL
jgi:hypothetical protein